MKFRDNDYYLATYFGIKCPYVIRVKQPFLIAEPMLIDDAEVVGRMTEAIREGRYIGAKVRDFNIILRADGCIVGGCDDPDALVYLKEMAEFLRENVLVEKWNYYKDYCTDCDKLRGEKNAKKAGRREESERLQMAAARRRLFGEEK